MADYVQRTVGWEQWRGRDWTALIKGGDLGKVRASSLTHIGTDGPSE